MLSIFSELPDSDEINRQVLLLGITRFETTPSPVPSPKLLSSARSVRERFKRDKDWTELNATKRLNEDTSSIVTSNPGIYESHEQLDKFIGCFPIDKKDKVKKTAAADKNSNNIDKKQIKQIDQKAHPYHQPHQHHRRRRRHRNHFDRLIERFQSKGIHRPNLGVNDNNSTAAPRTTAIEQNTFYRWLHLSRTKRLEHRTSVKCLNDADQWHSSSVRSTPVIRKCSTKSNSIRKATKIKQHKKSAATTATTSTSTALPASSSSSRFSSCIPYCVSAAKSRTNSIADNSLASSQHPYTTTEYRRKRSGTASVASSGSIIDQHRNRLTKSTSNDHLKHFHCKSHRNCDAPTTGSKYADINHKNNKNKNHNNNNINNRSNNNNNNINNNNCSQFNNLNIMDRSVDSIGSCSLDVDAESTDFSGIVYQHQHTLTHAHKSHTKTDTK